MSNIFLKRIALFLIFLSTLLYIIESITYQGFVQKYIFASPEIFAFVTCVLLVIKRLFGKISHTWVYGLTITSLFSLILSISLIVLDLNMYSNFVFSTLRIHPELLVKVGLLLSMYALLSINISFVKNNFRFLLINFPIWLLMVVTVFWFEYPELYHYFKEEDSAIEYLTFFAYLSTTFLGILSLKLASHFPKNSMYRSKIFYAVFILIIIGSFLIAGEEISWGQRIIGFDTPENIMKHNQQQEFNFHNTSQFMSHIYYMYALITLIAITLKWFAEKLVERFPKSQFAKIMAFFSPPTYLIGFFMVVFLFSLTRLIEWIPEYPNYPEETIEFILGLGISLAIFTMFQKISSKKKLLN